ncbi:MAG: aminoacyl-tRNA hydrolase [Anaerolineae bacterium]|nr:aminoacyl-tRNA hydrolase [Anaerolineae bacterium]
MYYMIVGLGNPGPTYAANRHNVGFRCVERLAKTYNLSFDRRQKKALVAKGMVGTRQVVLVKPQTFMNDSGLAVAPLARFYRIEPARLLVVYDDLDLPFGTIRLRPGGGSGGHRGMLSIITQLGTQHFPRLRIGIGRPPGQMDPAAYVLQDFAAEEELALDRTLQLATEAIVTWLHDGIEVAMSRYNAGREA